MASQIWSKIDEKWAYVLVLRDHEVYRLKVTGLRLRRKVGEVLEALGQGQHPSAVGASGVDSIDVRTINKAELSPGNSSLKLYGGPHGSKSLNYSTGDDNADAILQVILAQSGRSFETTQEEIGVVEALIAPGIVGVLGWLFWMALHDPARRLAAGEVVEAKGRRKSIQQLFIWVAEMLGTTGTTVVGVVLLVLIVGCAVKRIVKRPQRTVWTPANA